jgi:hydrogenase maturation protease
MTIDQHLLGVLGTARPSGSILIAGVGNVLCGDDGVGVHAVRELQKEPIAGVEIVDIGTAILHGLHFLESADRVLVIDAAKGGQPPGSVYLFDPGPATQAQPIVSIHSIGLREATRLFPPGQPLPAMTVIGVEPRSLECGMDLSEPVRAALPCVLALIRKTVAEWLQDIAAQEVSPIHA